MPTSACCRTISWTQRDSNESNSSSPIAVARPPGLQGGHQIVGPDEAADVRREDAIGAAQSRSVHALMVRRRAIASPRDLQRRGRRLRPLHGQVLGAAGPAVRGAGRRHGWTAGARRRLRSRSSDRGAGETGSARRRSRPSTRPSRSWPPLASASRRWTSDAPPRSSSRSRTGGSTPPLRSSSSTSWPTPCRGSARWVASTRREGVVAACVWDHEGGQGPLSLFWDAAREQAGEDVGEASLAGAREGHLAQLFDEAGLRDLEERTLTISVEHAKLRRVVGAVHARCRPRWCASRRPRRGGAGRAPRTLPRPAAGGAVRDHRPGLGRARAGVAAGSPRPRHRDQVL